MFDTEKMIQEMEAERDKLLAQAKAKGDAIRMARQSELYARVGSKKRSELTTAEKVSIIEAFGPETFEELAYD